MRLLIGPKPKIGTIDNRPATDLPTAGLDVFVQDDVGCLLTDLTLLSSVALSERLALSRCWSTRKARLKVKIRMVHPSDRSHHAIFVQRWRL
jgi:hypothetical protein